MNKVDLDEVFLNVIKFENISATIFSSEGNGNISNYELKKSLDAVHPKIFKNGLSLLCIDTLVSVLEKLGGNNGDPALSLEVLKNLIPNEALTNEYAHRLISWFLLASYTEDSSTSYFTHWLLVCVKIGVINEELVKKNYFKPLMFSFLRQIPDNALSHLLKFLSDKDNVSVNLLCQLVEKYNQEENTIKKKQLAVLLKYYLQILPSKSHDKFKCKKVLTPSILSLKDKSLIKVIERILSINSTNKSLQSFYKMIQSQDEEETQIETDFYFGLSPAYSDSLNGVRLSSLTGLQDIVKHYDHIIPPTNILAVLQSKCGHLYVRFSSPSWVSNLQEQIALILKGILNNSVHPNIIPDKFLNAMVSVQTVGCESLLSVSDFLKQYIIRWDTVKYRNEIVQLIPWLYFSSENDLKNTMRNLFTVFITAEVKCKVLLLNALVDLYINLMITVNQRIPNNSRMHYKPPKWMINKPQGFFLLFIEMFEKFVNSGLLFHDSSPAFLSQTIIGYYKIFVTEKKFDFKILNDKSAINFTLLPISVVLMCHTSTCITIFNCLLTILSAYWEAQESILSNLNEKNLDDYNSRYQYIEKYTTDTIERLLSGVDSNNLDGSLMGQIMKHSDKEAFKNMFSQTKGLLSMTKHFATSHIAYELTRKMRINLSSIQQKKYMDLLEYFAPRTCTMLSKLGSKLDTLTAAREANDESNESVNN